MKRWKGILWMAAVLMLCAALGASAEKLPAASVRYVLNNDSQAHELAGDTGESYIFPSIGAWQPYAEGGEKHVLVSASGEWYVEYCPDWVDLYVLESTGETFAGESQWGMSPVQIAAEGEEPVLYPSGLNVFMRVEKNDTADDRRDVIHLMLADGTQGWISVSQARWVEKLDIKIVKPCADAVDSVTAGYPTDVLIEMSNAVAGRVRILDAQGAELYCAEFSQEKYAFEYVFESGCYVICAEATGEAEISEDSDGYIRKTATLNVYELEVLEEVGVTRQYVEYLKAREGKRNKPYRDSGGKWTIGYGHLLSDAEAQKYAQKGWSDQLCEEQLIYDLKFHADLMRERLGEELYSQLTPNQFDALVSLEFNGSGRAVGSEYRLGQCLLNLDSVEDWKVINGFITWHGINNGTIDVLGLYYRRMEEAKIFLYADYSIKYNWPQPWWLNIGSNGTGTSIHDVPSGKGWYTEIMPSLEVNTSLIEAGGTGKTEYITIRSSRSWSIEIDEECTWVSASSYRGSSGNVVGIEIAPNDGQARHAVIRVLCGAVVRTIHVHQEAGAS